MYIPTANSYFSGGGLFDIGFMLAGVNVQQSLDIDPVATAVMRSNPHYFGHKVLTEDITKKLVMDQPESDIMLFTYPCTKYSTIADIHGARTGDELYLHALRHAALKRPEMIYAENVPGMKKFPVVMEAMTNLPGYYFTVICPLDAAVWLPQRRKRLIIIGTKKPFSISAPAHVRNKKTLKDIIEKDPVYDMPDYVIARINGKYRDKPIIVNPDDPGAIAPTCVAHYAKDLGTRLVVDKNAEHGLRPFSVREWARLQGVPDDINFNCSPREAYRIIGNGVAVDMGKWCGEVAMSYFNQNKAA